ncbi:ATP synthase F1 subunit epsilon [Sulfuricurvum sp.]|uniref:ATP synthase F1 subunit epsilon n=1 Tax=Sulfuricurvum sp. TaxID=2025608 RepID=UPI00261F001D|nr:ATP synthase F1 subunit epsilon [Sulfuricurvum sp.]MDD2266424.1 ATP synthase F1 subunit epsilon [Sulfuricurvum sp.]MDD2785080.1 ATP synthase F1 subunit epsilon [Sulfuricurvum sp.]HZF69249.1 ATP synthase F1 subunit epsilon [Sulfuricurvum sp.]
METLQLEVLTPSGSIFNGPAKSVTLPGEEGEFGVLPEHVSLTTLLQAGVVDIQKENGKTESIVVNWGVVQITDNKVVVLVDGAVAIRGESEGDIAKALDEAKSLINSITDSNVMFATVSARIESAAHNLV